MSLENVARLIFGGQSSALAALAGMRRSASPYDCAASLRAATASICPMMGSSAPFTS